MTVDQMRAELLHGVDCHEERFAYLSEVAMALGERSGVSELLMLFDQAEDVDAARAIVFAIAECDAGEESARSFLRTLLADDREFVVAEALDGLGMGQTQLDATTLEGLAQHQSPYVRGALLRYLSRVRGRSAVPMLMAGLDDGSHIVRQNAVDELEELDAREAVPALRGLLDDSHPHVREAVRCALRTLASV